MIDFMITLDLGYSVRLWRRRQWWYFITKYAPCVCTVESSDDGGALPEAKPPRKEAVYDFSDTDEDDVEEMEKRLRKIEANVRRKQKVGDT